MIAKEPWEIGHSGGVVPVITAEARDVCTFETFYGDAEENAAHVMTSLKALKHHDALVGMLQRLNEKVKRANAIQHRGGEIVAEDWSELYSLSNEAAGILQTIEAAK